MDTNQLPETPIPRKLFGQCFQDSRLRLGSRLLNLVKLTHPQDLVLHQIFYYSPQMGMEILSNAPGMPPHPLPWDLTLTGAFQFDKVCNVGCRFKQDAKFAPFSI